MGHIQAFKKIKKFEQEHNVWDYKIDSVFIWPLIKFDIFNKIGRNKNKSNKQDLKYFLKIFSFTKFLKSILFIYKKERVRTVYFSQPDARRLHNNKYFNTLFDIDVSKDKNSELWEWPSPKGHHNNNFTHPKQLKNLDFVFYWTVLKSRIFKEKKEICFLNELKNLGLNENEIRELILNKLNYFNTSRKIILKLLKKKKVEKVYLKSNYSIFHAALVSACRQLKILSIERQHGIISPYHPAYFYSFFPKYNDNNVYWPFPNKLEVFGKYFKEIIKKGNVFQEEDIITKGYDYLKFLRSNQTNTQSIIDKIKLKNEDRDKQIITFSSQWINRDISKDFILKLLKILPKKYIIMYKTHPLETGVKNFYHKLIKYENFYLLNDSQISIYDIFNITDIHCGIFSTCIYESFVWDIPNIIIKTPDTKNVSELEKKEGVYFVENKEKYLLALKNIDANKKENQIAISKLAKYYFN